MITFRPKHVVSKDLTQEAIEFLTSEGIRPNIISSEEADYVSKVNSRALVITKFWQSDTGKICIEVKDKEGYRYTRKLFEDIYKMKITKIDKKERLLQAETDYLGRTLEMISILGRKYNLSIVSSND